MTPATEVQAPGFYERLGYTIFGTLEDYPPGHSRFFFRKTVPSKPKIKTDAIK